MCVLEGGLCVYLEGRGIFRRISERPTDGWTMEEQDKNDFYRGLSIFSCTGEEKSWTQRNGDCRTQDLITHHSHCLLSRTSDELRDEKRRHIL